MEGKKKGRFQGSSSTVNGVCEAFGSTGNTAGSFPLRLQVDGAWKKIKKVSGAEWVAGAGWFATWENNQREGNQYFLLPCPYKQKQELYGWL